MKKKIEVPEADAAYIRDNYTTQSAPAMAKELKRATTTIYAFMEALKLQRLSREISHDHPFKVQNRKLEVMLTHNRIENGKLKKTSQHGQKSN